MTKNPRGYNGLQMPFGGQVHSIARQPSKEELQALVSQQLNRLAQEIYVRAAADMTRWPESPQAQHFRDLAHVCQIAAKAYMEAAGVKFEEETSEEQT